MKWIQNPTLFLNVEEAILTMSGENKQTLLAPKEEQPKDICGIPEIADIIKHTPKDAQIVIVGDYDADGITATAILTKLLSGMGHRVKPIIPKRFTNGYGVSDAILEGIQNSLIITVDNGITAGEVLDKAVSEGNNTVAVIDHHLPDGREPQMASVICDPHMEGDTSPFKDYCGAGLAFKLAQYILRSDYADTAPDDMLVLACIGTIADSMPLIGDNRAIVMQGLRLINSGEARLFAGINYLLWTACGGKEMDEETIGFTVAPLINAPGRLFNAGGTSVLKALLCTDPEEARGYISKMVSINADRKEQVEKWMKAIQNAINAAGSIQTPLVVYAKEMPEGLVGLVAGKLAEIYHTPTIVLVDTDDGVVKGSGRSFGSFDMKGMLDALSDKLLAYGGHTGAAGLSLAKESVKEFRQAAREYCKNLGMQEGGEYIQYDVVLRPDEVPEAMATMKRYKPFGQGVPKPVCMIQDFQVRDVFEMGTDKTHVKLIGDKFSAVAFGMAQKYRNMCSPEHVDIVGTLGENVFRDEVTIQVLTQDFQTHA